MDDIRRIQELAGITPTDEYELAVEAFLTEAPSVSLGQLNESTGLYELNLGAFGKAVSQKVTQGANAIQQGVSGGKGSVGDMTTNLFVHASNAIKDNPITGRLEQMVKQNPKMALFATAVLAVIGTTALQGMDATDLTSAVDQLVQGTQVDDQAADALQNIHDAGIQDVAPMTAQLDQEALQGMKQQLQTMNIGPKAVDQAVNMIHKALGQYPTNIDALLDAADQAAQAYADGNVQITGGKGYNETQMQTKYADYLSRFANAVEGQS